MNTSNYELTGNQTNNMPIERFRPPHGENAKSNGESHFELAGTTPLGQLLKLIGSLPEIRHEKVDHVRRQINHGQYDINTNLDAALDKVLEEFLMED